MMDTYVEHGRARCQKQMVKGVVTGKPVASGGTLGRAKATGQGMVFCIVEWAKETRLQPRRLDDDACRGSATSARTCAVILSKLGVSTIAVGDHTGYMYNPEGFNAHKLQDYVEEHGIIAGYPGGKAITREEFFATKADIFAPSRAREPDRRGRGEGARSASSSSKAPTVREPGGREDPPRPRHRHPARRARQLRRRHGQLLRVGAEQALGELDGGRGRRAAREGDEARVPRGERLRAHQEGATCAWPRTRSRSSASRRSTRSARSSPDCAPTERGRCKFRTRMPYVRTRLGRWFYEERGSAKHDGDADDRPAPRACCSTEACGGSRSSRCPRSGAW